MSYFTRVAIAFDTLCNVIVGNRIDETLSTHAMIEQKHWPWSWLYWCLDTVFPKHCEHALRHDQQRSARFNIYAQGQERRYDD